MKGHNGFRTAFCYLFLILLTLFPAPGCQNRPEAPAFQNVILISFDDLRADRLGCYGNERPVSPFIDSLARKGAFIGHAYTPYPFTPPSHISMLTSLYPTVFDIPLEKNIPTLASLLSGKGFKTFAYTGGGHMSADYGALNGFDAYDDEVYGLKALREKAASFLGENRENKFFLFMHTYHVHLPYRAPEEVFQKYADPNYDGPVRNDGKSSKDFMDRVNSGEIVPTPADIQRFFDLYDAQIPSADDFVRHIVETLEALNISRNTLLILTSDHGEQFGEFGRFAHSCPARRFAEISTHVPLIFYSPGLPQTGRLGIMAELIDIPPTVMEALGLDIHESFQGQSLFPLVSGRKKKRFWTKERVFYATPWQMGVRTHSLKLVLNKSSGEVLLFDLVKDPKEKRDVAKGPEYARLIPGLIDHIESFKEKNALIKKNMALTEVSLAHGLPLRPLSFDRHATFLLTFDGPAYIVRKDRSAETLPLKISGGGKGGFLLQDFKKANVPINAEVLQESGAMELWFRVLKNTDRRQTLMTSEWREGSDVLSVRLYDSEKMRYGIEVSRRRQKKFLASADFTFQKNKDWNYVCLAWLPGELFFFLNGDLRARFDADTKALMQQDRTRRLRLSGEGSAVDDIRLSRSPRIQTESVKAKPKLKPEVLKRLRELGYIK